MGIALQAYTHVQMGRTSVMPVTTLKAKDMGAIFAAMYHNVYVPGGPFVRDVIRATWLWRQRTT